MTDLSAEVAAVDNRAERAVTGFCWWRADLDERLAERYWRDVHGPLAARIPGLWSYRQLRLAPNRTDVLGELPDIRRQLPLDQQPRGIPQASFLSAAHQRAFIRHPMLIDDIFNDELRFLARGATQTSPPGAARTLTDRTGQPTVQGPPAHPTFAVFLAVRDEHGFPAAHHALAILAGALRSCSAVARLRVQPLQPYDPAAWKSPGVDHRWPGDLAYAGWLEMAVGPGTDTAALLNHDARRNMRQLVEAVHAYPIREVYTMVAAGHPTEVGLRGFPGYEVIVAAGADNQRAPGLLRSIFGDAVDGVDRLAARPRDDEDALDEAGSGGIQRRR
jgi:hypothetical protein